MRNRIIYLDTTKAQIAVRIKGGATKTNEIVRLNPNVAVSVGKKALNDNAFTSAVNAIANHHTFKSFTANKSPLPNRCISVSFWSPTPASSAIRVIASSRSAGVSQRVVVGKSGKMKIAMMAMATVKLPSM